jgi:hypothetical protein
MNLECPLLALWGHYIVHLLDFLPYVERLLTQTFSHLPPIDRARLGVGLRHQCCPARRGKHAAPTGTNEALTGFLVTSSGVIWRQPDWNIDAEER